LVKTYIQLYSEARRRLAQYEEAEYAAFLARQLILHVSGKSNAQFLADQQMYAPDAVTAQMAAGVERLCNGEPLAYVLGEWEFYGLQLTVTPDVLIPRDDTCAVAQLAMGQALFLPESPRILDLCTGSGCIGLAIASRIKDARVTLADISKEALAVAKKNAISNKLSSRISCVQADALGDPPAFLGKFDMIVSNPPYIDAEDMQKLEPSVANFEPHLALYGGEDGLDFYRAIVKNYKTALKPGGYIAFEFGEDQGDDICAILEANGFIILDRVKDYHETERAVLAQLGGKEEI
jgi:release factor glutamine methyltransferase